ncbi:stage III sporulation protein AF [Paenibacillus taichungensis]|uniref:stage III sporulation protein AF n=1 Tax=Paenibacillus taichungensis TaxID=484184 RepID=UPI002DB9EDC7|nr:stage III sporulation protein AF [Paenibacillus taichungensis]MEC0108098.1 stage III sporulation protein AF [Paenibacillus taichungensis]MEC0199856.1 stage III sporulation protein AF [Paenibacillus taichungensis]
MGWLSSWLRELIMIVLLATFVDMLLPNRSMERYVKLVLSLLILLTLLSPITKLLKSDPVGELKRAMTAMDSPSDGNATLEQILAQGRRLQSNEQEQSLQWTAKELANVMKGQIEETTGERVQSVEVKLAMDTSKPETDLASSVELPVIQYVLVEMSGETAAGKVNSNTAQQEATATTKPIFDSDPESQTTESPPVQEPIEIGQIEVPDVQIEVNSVSKSESNMGNGNSGEPQNGQVADSTPVSGEQAETNTQQGQTSSRSERAVQIITLLTEKWDIDANKVQVKEKKSASTL